MSESQPRKDTSLHDAALRLDEAIELIQEHLASACQSPEVERLARCAESVLRERKKLRKALESDNQDMIFTSIMRLVKKIFRCLRILKSLEL